MERLVGHGEQGIVGSTAVVIDPHRRLVCVRDCDLCGDAIDDGDAI